MVSAMIPSLGFNGHPPLGVNATWLPERPPFSDTELFQWAPTLGGECYNLCTAMLPATTPPVSMGTHPWG